mmetsp:Transcript_6794/g.28924  ORF Transcript_6794/g.28924 Transcript_6794/m.28924 type:complete len:320 (+) Transcript_6794:1804-2763(+)
MIQAAAPTSARKSARQPRVAAAGAAGARLALSAPSSLGPDWSSPPHSPESSTSERSGRPETPSSPPPGLDRVALARATEAAMFSARFARRTASFSSFFAFASARFKAFLPRAAPAAALSLSGVPVSTGVPFSTAAPEAPAGPKRRAAAADAGVLPLRSPASRSPRDASGDEDEPAAFEVSAPFHEGTRFVAVLFVSPTGRANVLCPVAICPFAPNRRFPSTTLGLERSRAAFLFRPRKSRLSRRPAMYRSSSSAYKSRWSSRYADPAFWKSPNDSSAAEMAKSFSHAMSLFVAGSHRARRSRQTLSSRRSALTAPSRSR